MTTGNKKIKYVAFYNDNSKLKNEHRITSLAINNKMDYIVSALVRNGIDVEIVSPCWTENKKGVYHGRKITLSDQVILRNFSTFGSSSKVMGKIKKMFSAIQLLAYLFLKVKRGEQIIVYHSLALIWPIMIAQYLKNIKIILEVEEVYTKVWKKNLYFTNEEKFIRNADKYIFASDILKEEFSDGKPSTVVYGSYEIKEEEIGDASNSDENSEKNSKDRYIDIVYAGSIDETKGGAKNSVECVKYLPERYRIHILGFGDQKSIDELNKEIAIVNELKGYECCIYHGVRTGREYNDFLLSCDIGLNPQFQGEYMDTAFPSKVLSYLSHDLDVVSTELKTIKLSKVASLITFSKTDDPVDMAESILKVDIKKNKRNRDTLQMLDNKFLGELRNLMST